MGSQKGHTTSTQKTEPWRYQQEPLKFGFGEAKKIYNQRQDGGGIAGFDSFSTQAQDLQAERALAGSNLNRNAQSLANKTLQGDYLGNNPYFEKAFNAAMEPVTQRYNEVIVPNIDSRFAGAGRFNSAAQDRAHMNAQENLSDSMADAAAKMMYNNYNAERARQDGVMRAAPGLANQDYVDFNALDEVGRARQALDQSMLDYDYDNLSRYMGLIGANYGGGQSSMIKPMHSNAAGAALGGAMAGAKTGAAVGSVVPGVGTGIGALAGGLIGGVGGYGAGGGF